MSSDKTDTLDLENEMNQDDESSDKRRITLPELGQDEINAYIDRTGYQLAHHPAYLLRQAHQRATACFQEVMSGDDLTPTQHAVLATLLKTGAMSQNHLGRLTQMDPSTISIVVKALIKRKLVKRERSKTDQRMTMITMTTAGVHYTLPLLDASMEVARRLLEPLSPAEEATLLELLKRVGEYGD